MGSVSQSPTTKNSSIENTVAAAEHTHDVYSAEDQTYIENQLRLLGYIE
jgi:hypothetical protein